MFNSALSTVTNYLYNNQDIKGLSNLNDQEILKAINTLSGLFKFDINLPRLITVGLQSAGKSSLIGGLIGINPPIGKKMETRCPLNLQLITCSDARAEFGNYDNGTWGISHRVPISLPEATPEQVYNIQATIKQLTNQIAGPGKNISDKEIILKIYSPKVPNLSLIDLPGLTYVNTDKSQPEDIESCIRNLITKYAEDKDSIILAVIPAREDIEADPAMGLAKKYDPTGERTIGILTKVDLMAIDHNISNYLENEVSVNLRLKHGYFAVNNVKHDSMTMSLHQENLYFQNHPVYSRMESNSRMGRNRLGNYLSNVLIDIIKSNIPAIVDELINKEKDVRKNMSQLGISMLTKSTEEKSAHCHMLISNFCKEYISALEEKGGLNYGRYIKQHFINYREEIRKIEYEFDENYVKDVIQNCNGNHMDFSIFSIEILETCLQDKQQKVFSQLIDPSGKLVRNVMETLNDLMKVLLKNTEMSRFHNFMNYIKQETGEFIIKLNEDIYNRIRDIIKAEESYIWTDDDEFVGNLKSMFQNVDLRGSKVTVINKLINMYMNTVKNTIADQIPKAIMCFMIKKLEENIYALLFENLKNQNMDELVSEKPEIEQKRQYYSTQQEKIDAAKKMLKI